MATNHKDAFGRFYRENLHGVRGYIARFLPGSPDTDDLANEAFINVLAAASEDRPVPPKAYLFATAHNLVMNHLRRKKVRGNPKAIEEVSEALIDETPGAERELVGRQRVNLLWEAMDQLPPRTKQVFVMRKIERLRNPQIAERLNISVSAVEKHLSKGMRICRAYLDQREDAAWVNGRMNDEGVEHG